MTSTDAARRVADGTGGEHDAILRALHVLEAALASPATGREEMWANRVARDLEPVVRAVVDHCRSAEAPDGLIRELEVALGRNAILTRVSDEHTRLAQEAEQFLAALGEERDVAAIRSRAAALAADLRAHQAHEADLILEAFDRDIGVGD